MEIYPSLCWQVTGRSFGMACLTHRRSDNIVSQTTALRELRWVKASERSRVGWRIEYKGSPPPAEASREMVVDWAIWRARWKWTS